MSKTITQLTDLTTHKGHSPSLNGIYSAIATSAKASGKWAQNIDKLPIETWQTDYERLFSTDDFFVVSHKMSPSNQDYVSFKVPLSTYEAVMHPIRYNALSTQLSTQLSLGNLAWKNESTLKSDFGSLAFKNTIDDPNLINDGKVEIRHINCYCGDLLSTDRADLNLRALASKDKITNADVAANANIQQSKIAGLKGLASMDYNDLHLEACAFKPSIDLSKHQGDHAGDYDITGILDIRHTNHQQYVLSAATNSTLGGIQTGFSGSNITRTYGVSINEAHNTYVEVPWTDTYIDDIAFTAEKKASNGFTMTFSCKKYQNVQNKQHPENSSGDVSITRDVTLDISIPRNVVLKDAINYSGTNLLSCITMFSNNNSDSSIKVEKGPQIQPSNTAEQYLKINGQWSTIPAATQSRNGLLSKEDKKRLDDLANRSSFYTLPFATNSTLGGIKVYDNSQPAITTFKQYSAGDQVIHLPVKISNQQIAYVDILQAVGDSASFTAAATEAAQTTAQTAATSTVNDKLASLYPKGSIYITTAATCPLSTLIPGSEWVQIQGRYLLASGQLVGGKNTEKYAAREGEIVEVAPGLPTHSHSIGVGLGGCDCDDFASIKNSHRAATSTETTSSVSTSIYGQSKSVRPPAFVVNVFLRTK